MPHERFGNGVVHGSWRKRVGAGAFTEPWSTRLWTAQRFREAARDLGTDESEAALDRVLRTVAKSPPAPMPKKVKARKKKWD
jgi:hypothetical protein